MTKQGQAGNIRSFVIRHSVIRHFLSGFNPPAVSLILPPMHARQMELAPGLIADARRALWLAAERVLAVADLHLGYAWAHRHGGQLLPLSAPEDTTERLLELQQDYQPREIVLLGDIVHRAVPVPALESDLRELIGRLAARTSVTLVRGNHDRFVDRLWSSQHGREFPGQLVSEVKAGPHLLLHGDAEPRGEPLGRIIMGHEHPAVELAEGVASRAKFPCFLAGPRVIVLPAFSPWAAGTPIGAYPFQSALAQRADFSDVIAIVGSRLLPLPWRSVA
jgi:putative SbcD/Mre11-related phosphoesterase